MNRHKKTLLAILTLVTVWSATVFCMSSQENEFLNEFRKQATKDPYSVVMGEDLVDLLHSMAENNYAHLITEMLDIYAKIYAVKDYNYFVKDARQERLFASQKCLANVSNETQALPVLVYNGCNDIVTKFMQNCKIPYPKPGSLMNCTIDIYDLVNSKDKNGQTAYDVAKSKGNREAMEVLVAAGAYVTPAENTEEFAWWKSHLDEYIKDPDKIDERDENGNRILHIAAGKGWLATVKLVMNDLFVRYSLSKKTIIHGNDDCQGLFCSTRR
jgi:hypothetical protein